MFVKNIYNYVMLYFDYYIEVLGNNIYMKHAFSVEMQHSFCMLKIMSHCYITLRTWC